MFDLTLSLIGIVFLWPIILVGWLAATASTGSNGFFCQQRVGKDGNLFWVLKLKTMRPTGNISTSVTTSSDLRITPVGKWLRKLKLDELPQLVNVLLGQMSFVGPRPDVPGFADKLTGDDRIVLSIRPGITGPATLAYRNEEEMLNDVENPEAYNREIIWPDKVRINREYIESYSFSADVNYIIQTVAGSRGSLS